MKSSERIPQEERKEERMEALSRRWIDPGKKSCLPLGRSNGSRYLIEISRSAPYARATFDFRRTEGANEERNPWRVNFQPPIHFGPARSTEAERRSKRRDVLGKLFEDALSSVNFLDFCDMRGIGGTEERQMDG